MKSTVSIFDSQSRSFQIRESDYPDPQIGEVVVRVSGCTICGSDIHTYTGRRSGHGECVLGHEIIGEVESWGGERPPHDFFGNPLQKDQRITWSLAVGCNECFFCKQGLPQKCCQLFKYGHEPLGSNGATGGLSQYCTLVPKTAIFPIPDDMPDSVACPANCATATVVASVRLAESIQALDEQTVLVSGIGMLGLTACAMIREKQAKNIVAVDVCNQRLQLAKQFGATHCVQVSQETDLRESVSSALAETGDHELSKRGVDVALEFAGVSAAVNACLPCLRTGGTLVLAGSVFPDKPIELSPEEIVRRILTIRGIHNYRPDDLAAALKFLNHAHRKYPFEKLVSKQFELRDAQEAFEFSCQEKPIRVLVHSAI